MEAKFCIPLLMFLIVALTSGQILVQSIPVDKYQQFGDSGKIFIETQYKYNWFEAWNECALRNMTLIAVDSAEKNSILSEILKKVAEKKSLWLGGHDQGEEGYFVWASTGKRFDFSNWSRGNPDDYNKTEDCALIWDVANYEWNDGSCWSKIGYICEENRFLVAARKDLEIKRQFMEQLFSL